MRPRLFRPVLPLLLAAPGMLRAQAMTEYALGAARSTGAAGAAAMGGCRIDADVFSCLNRNHPTLTMAVIVVVCVLAVWWLAGGLRSRSY